MPEIDAEPDYPRRGILRRLGYCALLAVPLLHEDRIIGALTVIRRTSGVFSEEVVSLVQAFAAQSSLAIQNANLFHEIEETGRQLAVASRHKSEFLANMSHELRSPLNAIIGFTRLVMRRARDALLPKQYENLEKILVSSEHLLSLINTVLDLSKIEAGRMEVRATEFPLEPLLDLCLATVEPMIKADRVRLIKDVQGLLPTLYTDQENLKQILINLLSNAAKFTEAGSITLRAHHYGERVDLAVADTGIGIPKAALELVFEEFRQVGDGLGRARGGTGLGLAISRRLARMLGGEITVTSEQGQGSTFTVTIPVRLAANAPELKPKPQSAAAPGAGHIPSRPREKLVLAIDDDPSVVYLLNENLADAGYRVIGAGSGEEGLQKARALRPCAITLDIVMPGMDGWQVLYALKTDLSNSRHSHHPDLDRRPEESGLSARGRGVHRQAV